MSLRLAGTAGPSADYAGNQEPSGGRDRQNLKRSSNAFLAPVGSFGLLFWLTAAVVSRSHVVRPLKCWQSLATSFGDTRAGISHRAFVGRARIEIHALDARAQIDLALRALAAAT